MARHLWTNVAVLCATALIVAGCSAGAATETPPPVVTAQADSKSTTATSTASAPARTSSAAPRSTPAGQLTPPVVVEDGWSLSPDGEFVSFGVRVRNDGPTSALPSITVTAIDASGAPLETKQEKLGFFMAGTDAYIGGTFIDSSDIANLQITTEAGQKPFTDAPPVAITAEATIQGTGYSPRIALAARSNSSEPVESPARIFFVFRDEGGDIVGGTTAFTSSSIQPGRVLNEAPFITGFAPDTATSADVTIAASVG
ncbi:hypothetical protein [Rhodococcoides corynebacterioides]|uniref:Uncharacterized protein n=1 Tax=Rhodococcoides corynebacterioides TaxID=53972 RepID=A0ABS7P722_9NOCA|nr:hypothetical protein [Rhodococcus corynebacterioides]MBY6366951.1 hypothetical protein [Rhodococcus corynebacterioides]MBY6407753.1 hypothetical protein [Rhodococcus corynebacterioides]